MVIAEDVEVGLTEKRDEDDEEERAAWQLRATELVIVGASADNGGAGCRTHWQVSITSHLRAQCSSYTLYTLLC